MHMQLNTVVIDSYVLEGSEVKKNLLILTNFIDHIDQPFEKEWAQIHSITEIALKHFQHLDPCIQQEIFHIAQRLTEQNINLCYDESNLKKYREIIQLWAQFSYLQTAIANISVFLTPARFSIVPSSQELDRAQWLMAFAIKHFTWLEESFQKRIKHLSYLITIPPLPELLEEPQLKHYQFIVNLLNNCPVLLSPTPSSPPNQPTTLLLIQQEPLGNKVNDVLNKIRHLIKNSSEEEDFVVVSPSTAEKNKWETEQKQREVIKQAQLQKICQLSHNICQHYFPLSWMGSNFQQKQFIDNFDQSFPAVAKEIFFQPPARASTLQIQIICQSLAQVVRFLKLFTKEDQNSLQFSKETPHKSLVAILEKFFLRWQPEQSSTNTLLSLITINSVLQLIKQFSNTNTLYFILERLLNSEPWDLEDFNPKKVPLEAFDTDKELTTQLGDILEALGQELICLGDPKWSANVASKALIGIIKIKKYSLAKKLQQLLHQIKSSPCSMAPLLIIHRILLNKHQNSFQATWFRWQNLVEEQKNPIKQSVENKLNNWLYQILIDEMAEHSRLGKWMIDQTSSIKDFCQKLTQRFWHLFQREENIQLLILYLLQGIEKILIETSKIN